MREWLLEQPPERFDRCLAILSVLGETKVYLFWSRDWSEVGVELR